MSKDINEIAGELLDWLDEKKLTLDETISAIGTALTAIIISGYTNADALARARAFTSQLNEAVLKTIEGRDENIAISAPSRAP
jgi:uncharacterized protein YejL (UPF0352 family)